MRGESLSGLLLRFVTILFALVSCVAFHERFSLRQHLSSNSLAYAPLLFDELESYIASHDIHAVRNDTNICSRKFVVATYACPQAVGNRMHEYLNAFIGAFILDRTVVWKFCQRKSCQMDNQQDCDDHLTRMAWIASAAEVESLWKASNCPHEDITTIGWPLVLPKFRWQSSKIMMCCGMNLINNSFVDFGTHDLHEMQV
jgi:hypothetical protein